MKSRHNVVRITFGSGKHATTDPILKTPEKHKRTVVKHVRSPRRKKYVLGRTTKVGGVPSEKRIDDHDVFCRINTQGTDSM